MRNDNDRVSNIRIEGAKLIFRNFSGNETEFNTEGNRNFGLVIPEEMEEELKADGWNVKRRPGREEGDPDLIYLPVKVKFGKIPPIIMMITSYGKVSLTEDTVGQLDWARIINADIVVRPYNYPAMAGRPSGISAYLKALYVTIEEDEFESKYADIPTLD